MGGCITWYVMYVWPPLWVKFQVVSLYAGDDLMLWWLKNQQVLGFSKMTMPLLSAPIGSFNIIHPGALFHNLQLLQKGEKSCRFMNSGPCFCNGSSKLLVGVICCHLIYNSLWRVQVVSKASMRCAAKSQRTIFILLCISPPISSEDNTYEAKSEPYALSVSEHPWSRRTGFNA